MKNLLAGQTAVVTGGNAGIGKAIALKLAEEGANVAVLGTNRETGATAVEEIKQAAPSIQTRFYPADVSKTAAVDEVLKQILQDFGHIDILVNNAGITADQLIMKMSEEEWDKVIAVNLKSCYNTCRAIIRPMMKARKGRIINISSVVGINGNDGQVNYAASKAGMIGFTKALAKEVASRNILVNCIAPGFIESKMTEILKDDQKQAILSQIPLRKMGTARNVADAVWFLASPLGEYITGQVLTVDGGMVM